MLGCAAGAASALQVCDAAVLAGAGKVEAQVASRPGRAPATVQPMRPAASPATRFCAGKPARLAMAMRFGRGRRALELERHEVDGARVVRDPVHRVAPAAALPDRTERGLLDRQHLVVAAGDGDALLDRAHQAPFVAARAAHRRRQPVAARVLRIELELEQVEVGAVAVGEAPGDLAVAAGDQRRRAGQRHADQPAQRRAGALELDRGAIPDVRQAQRQVHVVGDDRRAALAAPAGDDPVVAADRGVVADVLEQRHLGLRRLAEPGRRLRRQRRGRGVDRRCIERRVVAARGRQQEGELLGGRALVAQPAAREHPVQLLFLQVEVHRPDDQQRVLRHPGPRRRPQHAVLERPRRQAGEAGVDARGIALEQHPVGLGQGGQGDAGAGAEAVDAALAVDRQQRLAEQRREVAGAGAAQQVHLEEALLRMDEAGGEGDVAAVAAADRRHALGVARHRDRAAQAGGGDLAVERRQAGAEERVAADRRREHEDDDEPEEGEDPEARAPAPRHRHRLRHRSPPWESGESSEASAGLRDVPAARCCLGRRARSRASGRRRAARPRAARSPARRRRGRSRRSACGCW